MADFAGWAPTPPTIEWSYLYGGTIPGTSIGAGATGGSGGTPPAVYWDSPSPGSVVRTTSPVVFRVVDPDLDLVRLVISVHYKATGFQEVIYRAGAFTKAYAPSQVEGLVNGSRFTLLRQGGWLGSPTVQVDAVDETGNPEELGA